MKEEENKEEPTRCFMSLKLENKRGGMTIFVELLE